MLVRRARDSYSELDSFGKNKRHLLRIGLYWVKQQITTPNRTLVGKKAITPQNWTLVGKARHIYSEMDTSGESKRYLLRIGHK